MPPHDEPEQRRGLKALLLLAETTRLELERNGLDPHSLTEKELKREIHENLKGGSVSFDQSLRTVRKPRRSFRGWAARELGWWLAIAPLGVIGALLSLLFLSLFGVLLVVYCIGRTTRSRLFLAAVCFIPVFVVVLLVYI